MLVRIAQPLDINLTGYDVELAHLEPGEQDVPDAVADWLARNPEFGELVTDAGGDTGGAGGTVKEVLAALAAAETIEAVNELKEAEEGRPKGGRATVLSAVEARLAELAASSGGGPDAKADGAGAGEQPATSTGASS